jgi:hypothetical protein
MDGIAEEQQLVRSCEILFGSHLKISREFLEYLQLSGLKGAYRKRAMETHPDAMIRGDLQSATGSNDKFHRVQKAYEQLSCYLKIKENRPLQNRFRQPPNEAPPPPSSARQKNGTEWSPGKHFHQNPYFRPTVGPSSFSNRTRWAPEYSPTENLYCGPLPQRRLLFGHFLYYSGLANWRTITRILTWQRTERPRLGELGCRFGMLCQDDVSCILQGKVPFQTFGQTARNFGILNDYQIRVLLFHQQRLQKKFGTILLEKGLIYPGELQELLYEFEQHNAGI